MEHHPYRDPSLSVELRVQDLLGRMTLEEKAAQTAAPFGAVVDVHTPPETGWGSATAALSTLGLPPREAARMGNELQRKHIEETRLGIPILLAEEALVGFKVRDATMFPDAIAQAATWEPELIEEMANTVGAQMASLGVRQALSPLADVARDPRWGRVEETYGEEPYLVGSMATAFVRGLQNATGNAPLIATLKHFIGYSASDGGRNTEAAQLGQNELREVHATPFERAIRVGGAQGVMPSYNAIDGVPVTGSRAYLTGLLRDELGFDGLVISDLAAVSQLFSKHGTAEDGSQALAQGIRAGVDLNLENGVSSDQIAQAVRSGLLAEADLDRAVANVLRAKFAIGLFEHPYVDVDEVPETLDSTEERRLARTIAEKSVVLLQNDFVDGAPLLPLTNTPRTIAVIGPNADRPMGQLPNYSYQVLDSITKRFALAADPQARMEDPSTAGADDAQLLIESVPIVTFVEGIRRRAGDDSTVLYQRGCPVATEDRSGFEAAVRDARAADVAVVVVGDQAGINSLGTVGEGLDSTDCELPGVQRELVEAVVATGTPTVVVLSHGRPYVLGWMAEQVPAVLTAFFGGEEAGNAVASVLFGDVNPAGRLPIALLSSVGAAPIPYWRTLQPEAYVDGSTASVFPFGHGLSYTRFDYRDLVVASADVPTDGVVRLSFTVANTGERAGDEVIQVYGHDVAARTVRRGRVLVAFRRLRLEPGAAARVSADVPASMFALWDGSNGWVVEPGAIQFFVGASSADIRLQTAVTLTGQEHLPGADRALESPVTIEQGEFR
ncbi:glycoside hydrolase family 3 N-terminal domain-containing protein [Phycicoccus sp. Soil803]|uniref:glycoside hydrolase family 3 N-terminal domain-containing protein n=1 Tax=Phycicoccus sp. Soil803 TaxID=1736415 RepID=UPI0007107A1B|nr:glycoside hydrolase family 3 N-terminal domain-containing protein [Phycicoccus sp. Soil803]KRF21825.1 glycosyl hydrolase family 3 [Phycicoccus sp. Soil803]